jgi:hypothetical protein
VGLITANSFMKREFGSKLIEQVLPRLDLTHVVDTSGAYIPGHGTPTVILFGRHRAPVADGVRTVMGIKGEPSTPDDPARGLVWSAIVGQIDRPGSESAFVSSADTLRTSFGKHPWSIAGGGAADLREQLEDGAVRLKETRADLGYSVITGEDNCLMLPLSSVHRLGFSGARNIVEGDVVRDWTCNSELAVLWPYDGLGKDVVGDARSAHVDGLWNYRTSLKDRKAFGVPVEQKGLRWWDLREVYRARLVQPLTITFAEVATHNHFVLDRGGKVFKQTAPVIKLPAGSSEDEHLGLLGLLNSSVAGFWLKQVSHQKQMMGGDGIRISEKSKVPYQFASTRVQELPIPANWDQHPDRPRLTELARRADALAAEMGNNSAAKVIQRGLEADTSIRPLWESALTARQRARAQLILIQEEIDFLVYGMYGLVDARELVSGRTDWDVALEAAFEIVLARRMAAGQRRPRRGSSATASTPITDVPAHWPEELPALWRRRIGLIRSTEALGVIEDPTTSAAGTGARVLQPGAGVQGRAARLAARPPGGPGTVAGQRRPAAAAHQRAQAGRRGGQGRGVHADRGTLCGPGRLRRPAPGGRAGQRRERALPARAALHRHRPAQARPVAGHLGAAAPGGRHRRQGHRRQRRRVARRAHRAGPPAVRQPHA